MEWNRRWRRRRRRLGRRKGEPGEKREEDGLVDEERRVNAVDKEDERSEKD